MTSNEPSENIPTQPWWAPFYDELLADMLLERETDAEVETTIDFIVRRSELADGAAIFDQCCGIGSLALPLAERGYTVFGVDQAANYIDRGQSQLSRLDPGSVQRCQLAVGDAFEYRPPQSCALAINWWTSFGYADTDAQNIEMLRRAYESLIPGGTFMLDTMNVPGIFRGFQPDVVTQRDTPRGPITLHRRSDFDLAAGRILKTWSYFLPTGATVRHETSVRLYLPSQLADMLRSVGFSKVELLGGLAGRAVELDDPRCICIARKTV